MSLSIHSHIPSKKKTLSPRATTLRDHASIGTLALVNAIMLAATSQGHGADTNASEKNSPKTGGSKETTQLPEVIVTGKEEKEGSYQPGTPSSPKFTEPLRDIPQTINIVPKAVIEEQGAATLRDVLKNVPGISIQAGEGGVPAGDNLSVRGFNARTDIFVDGVRDFGGYSRDPFNLEQVEVVKGPSSSYSGRGSTGGSINMISKTPVMDTFYSGTVGFGTDNYMRHTLDVNQAVKDIGIDGTALRLNAMWHDADTPGRDYVSNSRWGLAPSIAFGLGSDTRLTLSYFHMTQDNVPDYGIPWITTSPRSLAAYLDKPAPVDRSNYYGLLKRDYERIANHLVTGKLEHDVTDWFSLRNLLRYGYTARDSVITAPRIDVTEPPTVRRSDVKSRDQMDEVWANQTDLTFTFDTAIIEHTFVTGIEYIQEEDINRGRNVPGGPSTSLYDPEPNNPLVGIVAGTAQPVRGLSDSYGLYAFDTLKITDQWLLTGGLRWDQFNLDFTPATGAHLQNTDEMLSWRTGLTFKPLPNGSIYAGYGTSFNPSAEGLTLADTATSVTGSNLEPEETRAFEIGTKWDLLDERLSLSGAIFRTEKINARTENPADPTDRIILDGQQCVDGLELGVGGTLTKEWKIAAAYTFLHGEVTSSKDPNQIGKSLGNTPEHTFSVWTTYQLPFHCEVGSGAQFIDDRFNNINSARIAPGYLLYDAMLAYHLNKNVTFRLNVYNLTDEAYIDSVGGGHYIPGPGRSAVLTTSFKF